MKKITTGIALTLALVLSGFTFYSSVTSWKIVEGYSIKYSGKKAEGIFTDLSGKLLFDATDLSASSFDVAVKTASISTGNGIKNGHAKSDKWFDAEKYPTIDFKSTMFQKTSTGYSVLGDLDLHGVKKQVLLPFTFKDNTFKSTFNISRLDYNVGGTSGLAGSVGEMIELTIVVPVKK